MYIILGSSKATMFFFYYVLFWCNSYCIILKMSIVTMWIVLPGDSFSHFLRVPLPPSIPPGPWTKMKWVKYLDWMNSLVVLRLVSTPRWVLALQLPSIWLLSVPFSLHWPLMWLVSITLADMWPSLWRVFCQMIQSNDLFTHACVNATRSRRSTHTHKHTHYKCGLFMLKCMFIEALSGASSILTWGSYSWWNLTILVPQRFLPWWESHFSVKIKVEGIKWG